MAGAAGGVEAGTTARVLHVRGPGGRRRCRAAGAAGARPGRRRRRAGAHLRPQPRDPAHVGAAGVACLAARATLRRHARSTRYKYYNAQFATGTDTLHEQCYFRPVHCR